MVAIDCFYFYHTVVIYTIVVHWPQMGQALTLTLAASVPVVQYTYRLTQSSKYNSAVLPETGLLECTDEGAAGIGTFPSVQLRCFAPLRTLSRTMQLLSATHGVTCDSCILPYRNEWALQGTVISCCFKRFMSFICTLTF
jgi:hypothetical protein